MESPSLGVEGQRSEGSAAPRPRGGRSRGGRWPRAVPSCRACAGLRAAQASPARPPATPSLFLLPVTENGPCNVSARHSDSGADGVQNNCFDPLRPFQTLPRPRRRALAGAQPSGGRREGSAAWRGAGRRWCARPCRSHTAPLPRAAPVQRGDAHSMTHVFE